MAKFALARKKRILNKRQCKRNRLAASGGFTLIEVVIALAVAAISLAAVTASVSQMIDAGSSMQERTYASWIAQNKIAEMRLANTVPDVSTSRGEIVYANLEWSWRATVSETGIDKLYRVDVVVSLVTSETPAASVSGFIGEPVALGSSNATWGSMSQAIGNTI